MVWGGMEIAVEPKDWSRLIDGVSVSAYARLLREVAARMKLSKYKKSSRGESRRVEARREKTDNEKKRRLYARIDCESARRTKR